MISVLNAQQSPWFLNESLDGIPVYTRKVEGSAILAYKANVVVNAPLAKVIAQFENEKEITRWYFQCVHSELIENESPNKQIIYLILHLPWPALPRDFVFRRTKSEDPKTGEVSYFLTALPNRLPLVKGMVRVQTIESIWRFTSLPNGETNIFVQQHTDPAGSLPPTIINRLSVETPYNTLKNLRKLITGKDA